MAEGQSDSLRQQVAYLKLQNASRIENGKPDFEAWDTYNSSIQSYEKSFEKVLKGTNIADLINERESPVVIDIMSTTSAISELFRDLPQLNKFGVAVSIQDDRSDDQEFSDRLKGIHHISGDLSDTSTWKNINQKMEGRKAHLILERGDGGLADVPVDQAYYIYSLNRMWDMLSNDNGVMLLQVPFESILNTLHIPMDQWITHLNTHNVEARYESNKDIDKGALMIIKKNASPEKLPFLETK